jgi:putative glycosyltransferase (TIGR04372 family)
MSYRIGEKIHDVLSKAKHILWVLHGKKTTAELATDYEIHPNSLLYKLCRWVGRWTGTIILTPHLAAVGNCAEDVYFGLVKARREGKKLIILWPYELPWRLKFRLTNVEVVNVESEYRAIAHDSLMTIAGRIILTVYFAVFRTLSLLRWLLVGVHLNNVYRIPIIGESTLWQPDGVSGFSWDVVESCDWKTQLATRLPVHIAESKRAIAERQREQLGLPADAWFVCLHVRESGFHKDEYVYRNANILNYLGAIEEITNRGGWVIRMGDSSMTRLPRLRQVIDYPFTEVKSPLMDVYLISQCRLYIGMSSGIYDVARLFQRPIILANMNNWMWPFPQLACDLGILKHVYSKSKKRFLSVREWVAEPWAAVSHAHNLGDDYVFYENTTDELRAIVNEYFDRNQQWKPTQLQRQFNELRALRGRELLSTKMYQGEDVALYYRKNVEDYDSVERYRLASRLESVAGVLGAEFLQQNWDSSIGSDKLAVVSGRMQ